MKSTPNTPAQTSKKPRLNTPPGIPPEKEGRGLDELIGRTWRLIDQASGRLADPKLRENDKIRWAGVMASAIGALNKLLWKAGAGQVEEDDLAQILSKVPGKYQKIIRKRLAKQEPAQTPQTKHVSFDSITRGDLVEIVWLDASLSRNVVKITNQVLATYKRTVGRFMGIYNDERYNAPHVIIQHEAEESGVSDVSSIPLAIIVGVQKLAPKTAMKNGKRGTDAQWTQPIFGGGTKIMTRRRRP